MIKNKEFNIYLLENLKNFTLSNSQEVPFILEEDTNYENKETSKEFYNTTIEDLDYKKSKTFFTNKFETDITSILNSPKQFNTMSPSDKYKVQQQLLNLCQREFEWKTYSKRVVRSVSIEEVPPYFKVEFEKFAELAMLYIHPNKEATSYTQRAYRNYFNFKFESFIKYIVSKLLETKQFDSISKVSTLTTIDFYNITKNHISITWIFNDIIKMVIKQAHENLFNDRNKKFETKNKYTEDALVVTNSSLQYSYQIVLAMNLINATLNYCNEQEIIDVDVLQLSRPIQHYLMYKTSEFARITKEENSWGLHCDNTATILQIFEQCNIYTDIIKEKYLNKITKKYTEEKKFVLPQMLEIDILRPLKMPFITPPPLLNISDIDELIKPVIFGEGNLTKSKKLLDSLSYSRSKKFGISETFLKLVTFFSEMKSNSSLYRYLSKQPLDICFPTTLDIDKQQYAYNKIKESHSTNISQIYIANNIRTQILGNTSQKIDNFSRLLITSQTTNIDSICYLLKEKEFQVLNSLIMDNKFAHTTIEVARWLSGYPVYITDILCLRLRLYPYEHWVSRTSGGLKHLLCDFSPRKITTKGIISVLQAYYASNNTLSKSFEVFVSENIISKKTGKKLLFNFFHNNYLDFTSTKNTLYFMYLHMELLKIEKSNQTSVNIEIDQTASGIVFLSLLLRDRKMAKAANLISKEKSCPYTFVMTHFEDFAKNHMTHKAERACKFLGYNRKLHKYALMCYTYNQTHIGRIHDFYNRWVEELGCFPTEYERNTLNEFATKYGQFIEQIFPNSTKKLKLLEEAMELVVNECNFTSIRTLEGEVITWSFYKFKRTIRTKFDPVSRQSSTYSILVNEQQKKPDLGAHKKKFLSYLIHSIDAAVLRFFIRRFAEDHNYIINHLHDCVILHPNYVENFYQLVEELYKSNDLYYLSEKLVFDQMRSSLSTESQYKLDVIKANYLSLCDDFKDEMNFDPRNIYKFEV